MIYTVSMPMTYDEIIKLLSVVHLGKPLKFKNACEYAIEIIKEYEKIKADEQAEEQTQHALCVPRWVFNQDPIAAGTACNYKPFIK